MILNYEVLTPYSANKLRGNKIFACDDLWHFKPRWKSYPKQYTPYLADQIIRDIKSDLLVIKPLNSTRSNGVLLVHKNNLDLVLSHILKRKVRYSPMQTETYSYWKHDENKLFIVEEFCKSKPIMFKEKSYDPTMRVFCILRHDTEKIYVNILSGFWKIPPKDLSDEKASLIEKHITFPYLYPDHAGIAIDRSDFLKVQKILNKMLPKLYIKILEQCKKQKINDNTNNES